MREQEDQLNQEIHKLKQRNEQLESASQNMTTHVEGIKSHNRIEYQRLEAPFKRAIADMERRYEVAMKQKDTECSTTVYQQEAKAVRDRDTVDAKHKTTLQMQLLKHEKTETLVVQAHQEEIELVKDKSRRRIEEAPRKFASR